MLLGHSDIVVIDLIIFNVVLNWGTDSELLRASVWIRHFERVSASFMACADTFDAEVEDTRRDLICAFFL